MRWYLYIMTNPTQSSIHCGYCTDIEKTIKFYNSLPSLLLIGKLNKMIYLEIHTEHEAVKERFEEINKMNKADKLSVVMMQNYELVGLVPGENIELN